MRVNICMIGHRGAGKSTLTAAITKVLSRRGWAVPIDTQHSGGAPRLRLGRISTRPGHTDFRSEQRRYRHYLHHRYCLHIDCPYHEDCVKIRLSAAQVDGAILVVNATDSSLSQTQKQLLLARKMGVPRVLVFLNTLETSGSDALVELLAGDVRTLLSVSEYDADATPFIRGSALAALRAPSSEHPDAKCIFELLAACDQYIPAPAPERISLHLKRS